MDCPTCGAECAAAARFCWSCGQMMQSLGEERRIVTVLFADLVGFTTMSQHLDPEMVKNLIDTGFGRLVRDVTAFGGRVDKIVGDAIVALFGAPVAHEDDAERAVRAALRMQATLAGYATESGIDIRMRVGVNTGEVLVGALRAGGDYTAMGDVVNTASRLEASAEPGEVLVGEATHAATSAVIDYEPRGSILARGRDQSIDVWVATAELVPPGHRPRRRYTPLVGRDEELATILGAVRLSMRSSRAQTVLVIGEAGVGKTRIASELARSVSADASVSIYDGQCVPYGEANPWWPVAEVLRQACGVDREASTEVALAAVTATVGRVCGVRFDGVADVVDGVMYLMGLDSALRGMEGTAARGEATRALVTLLECAAAKGPLLVRLADLHWADDVVLALIDDLADQLARQPIVFLATTRRVLQERWTPRQGRANHLVINLGALGREASDLLLDSLLVEGTASDPTRSRHVDGATREMLLDRSGGNPFYLEELVTLLEQRPSEDTLSIIGEAELPDTLRGLVAARIDALTIEEQNVLEDAAVWGPSGGLEVLRRLAAAVRGVGSCDPIVQSLNAKDVLVLRGEDWSFRSDLIREVTYARLTKRDRLVRHGGIARYLSAAVRIEDADDRHVEIVARHFTEAVRLAIDLDRGDDVAELLPDTLRWLEQSAERCEGASNWPQAEACYSDALELEPDPSVRLRLLLGRSLARSEQWAYDSARADAADALELSDALGDDAAMGLAKLRLGQADMRSVKWERANQELTEAVAIFAANGDEHGRAEALRFIGMAYLLRGDQQSAAEPITAALEAYRCTHDRRGEAWALQNLAWIAFTDGRVDEAAGHIAESQVAFVEVGDNSGLSWVAGLSAFVELARGHLESAHELADGVLRESERRGDQFAGGMMRIVQAGVQLWSGRSRQAAVLASEAVDRLRQTDALIGLEQALLVQGRAEVMSGRVRRGLDLMDEAAGAHDADPSHFTWMVRLLTQVQVGRPERLLQAASRIPGDGTNAFGMGPEPLATWALASVQFAASQDGSLAGESTELAPEALDAARRAVDGEPGGGYEWCVLALVCAAHGLADDAVAARAEVASAARSTYLDRTLAAIAVALSDLGPAGDAALASAHDEVDLVEDRLIQGLLALATAARAGAVGAADAGERMADAEMVMASMGLVESMWREVFEVTVSRALPSHQEA